MTTFRARITAAALVCAAVLVLPMPAGAFPFGGPAQGLRDLPRFIEARQPTLAPMGHVVFCARKPHLCEPRGGARTLADDRALRATLARVNREINGRVHQVADLPKNGLPDVWKIADDSGDCEDIALAKRERLIALGISPRALRMGVARTPWGEGHAVLVVRTSSGDLVLDNRDDVIRTWRETDLSWIKIQSGDNPRRWFSI